MWFVSQNYILQFYLVLKTNQCQLVGIHFTLCVRNKHMN